VWRLIKVSIDLDESGELAEKPARRRGRLGIKTSKCQLRYDITQGTLLRQGTPVRDLIKPIIEVERESHIHILSAPRRTRLAMRRVTALRPRTRRGADRLRSAPRASCWLLAQRQR
jgi:hypothetical protein